MSNTNNNKNTSPAIEAPKRGRGRPATFPGQETVAFLTTVPVETRQMLRDVASKRGETINATIARFIENGFKAAMRNRSKKVQA